MNLFEFTQFYETNPQIVVVVVVIVIVIVIVVVVVVVVVVAAAVGVVTAAVVVAKEELRVKAIVAQACYGRSRFEETFTILRNIVRKL